MEIYDIMKERHSVRQYASKPIEAEKRSELDALASEINREKKLNVQIFYDEPKCFDSFMVHYGKFSGVENYIALIGKKSSELDETMGYCGEMLVLKAQELGLNTCWVGLTHGKSKAVMQKDEKCFCIISLGYGKTGGVMHKSKPVEQVCNYSEAMPQWFKKGVEAALLAPTAVNQQKFFFELLSDNTVRAVCGSGFYTKLDLGIVKYHFELGAGKENFKWE